MNLISELIRTYGTNILQVAIAWIVSIVIFAALIIYLSKHPQKRNTPLKITFCIMFLGGMAIYCTCHYLELTQVLEGKEAGRYLKWVNNNEAYASVFHIPYIIVRSVVDVGMMFSGRINSEVFFNLDISHNPFAVFLFWIVHLVAFFTTAAALLIRFGNDLLKLNVYTCDSKSVRCYSHYAQECRTHWLYDSELLYSGELDQYAMELNHRYTGGKDKYEDWKNCDYFGKMSSRASVDYLMPLIRRIKKMMNTDALTSEQRENLARSEHLRWCAFHYTFGFDVMSMEEFTQRVKDYQNEIREHGKSSIKITKDSKARRHVCLVDWDKLDEISRLENSITHGNRNYKDSDRQNIDMVMSLMKE